MMLKRLANLVLTLGALAFSGCSGGGSSSQQTVKVDIAHASSEGGFNVTWVTQQPVRGLVFPRAGGFRVGKWKTKAADQNLIQEGGYDVIVAPEATQRFEVFIPRSLSLVTGDYPLISKFSDGGVVLYTGHLNVAPVICLQEECTAREVDTSAKVPAASELRLHPAGGESVLAQNQQSYSSVTVRPPPEGTMVYFGRKAVQRWRGYGLIADHRIPKWVLNDVERLLPQILKVSSRRLGHEPLAEPVLFLPYNPDLWRNSSVHSAAVVDNQMLISLFGNQWGSPNQDRREQFARLLAHESFHLWNGVLFRSVARPGGDWLHEGSADAFAYLALLEIGAITQQQFMGFQNEALNRCLVGLSRTNLPSSKQSDVRNHYDCGAVMQVLLHKSLRERQMSLWSFWSDLFEKASSNGGFYDHDEFFALVEESTNGGRFVSYLKSMAAGEVGGGADTQKLERFFFQMYRSAGIGLRTDDTNWPIWYRRFVAEKALGAAIDTDCGTNGGYAMAGPDSIQLVGGPRCRNLRGSMEVSAIGGFRLWDEGIQAYEHLRTSCLTAGYVLVFSADRSNVLGCPKLSQRPRFLRYPSFSHL